MVAASGDDEGRPPPPDSDGAGDARVPTPWGEVVIPDDVSELDAEAAQVRHELRHEQRHRRWLGGSDDAAGTPGVTGPLLIVVLAMVVTLTSLFGGFWPALSEPASNPPVRGVGDRLPRLTLYDSAGVPVRLWEVRTAVVLAVGRCGCPDLLRETATLSARERLTLLVVGTPEAPSLPTAATTDDRVDALADPQGRLARAVAPSRAPKQGTAVAVLVRNDSTIAQVLTDVRSAEEFTAGLARLR